MPVALVTGARRGVAKDIATALADAGVRVAWAGTSHACG
jgi:NAD(P)-dependent dehydrogenase (short-subunit alcohol dehydrogenase family)